jgi:hypothetical protein
MIDIGGGCVILYSSKGLYKKKMEQEEILKICINSLPIPKDSQ